MKKNKHNLGKNIRKKLGFSVNEYLNFTDMSAKLFFLIDAFPISSLMFLMKTVYQLFLQYRVTKFPNFSRFLTNMYKCVDFQLNHIFYLIKEICPVCEVLWYF